MNQGISTLRDRFEALLAAKGPTMEQTISILEIEHQTWIRLKLTNHLTMDNIMCIRLIRGGRQSSN